MSTKHLGEYTMKVNLINYDMNALDILLYTKNTRLRGSMTLKDVRSWSYARKLDELGYMRNTIQSSLNTS